MRLLRFTGTGIHGYRRFNIKFNKDITFLTGINGSGKTTVLNAISALVTPSLYTLADLSYNRMRLDFEDQGEKGFIEASRDGVNVKITGGIVGNALSYTAWPEEQTLSPASIEAEQEYYRDLLLKYSNNTVLLFIKSLPTPMFLGLDRRTKIAEEAARMRPSLYRRSASRSSRYNPASSTNRGLVDAASLAEDAFREVFMGTGRISETSRRDLLLRLLAVEPTKSFNYTIELPTKAEIAEISAVRKMIVKLPKMLNLPDAEVLDRIKPFLDSLDQAVAIIPPNVKVSSLLVKDPDEQNRKIMAALLSWNQNRSQLTRVRQIASSTSQYDKEAEALNEPIKRYLELVNAFLHDSGKELRFDARGELAFFSPGVDRPQPIWSMSSGESQIFVILTHLAFNRDARNANVFIIDEPELSLHVTWQELFVDSVLKANPDIQYIMATHSPSIILERVNKCTDISLAGSKEA